MPKVDRARLQAGLCIASGAMVVGGSLGAWTTVSLGWFGPVGAAGTSLGWGIATLLCGLAVVVAGVWALLYPTSGNTSRAIVGIGWLSFALASFCTAHVSSVMSIAIVGAGLYATLIGSLGCAITPLLVGGWRPSPLLAATALALLVAGVVGGALWGNADSVGRASARKAPELPAPFSGVPAQPTSKVSLRVNSYWATTELGSGFMMATTAAEPGKQFLVVNVGAENKGSSEAYVMTDCISLVADDRNIYSAEPYVSDARVNEILARLLPGGVATGDAVFEVSQNVKPVELRYEPGLW